jgi:heat shock protein HtpX
MCIRDRYQTVEKLAKQANLPMPRLYITPSSQPNAFATGRNPRHAVVAVTEGILQILTADELEGVLAHELAHVRNNDILVGSIAAMMAGTISMIANIAQWGLIFGFGDDEDNPLGLVGSLIAIIIMPIAALLVQLAISRSREFKADETGAAISGRPDGLANALLKLERGSKMVPMDVSPAAAHMFIVSPLSGRSFASLFSTHPPINERVSRLRAMQHHL